MGGACRKEGKELRVQIKRQASDLAAMTAARDQATAAARVVGEERADMKREWSEMFAAHDGLQQRISALQHQLADECSSAQVRNHVCHSSSRNVEFTICGADIRQHIAARQRQFAASVLFGAGVHGRAAYSF